ncbi:MAG: hypothetical protein ACFFAU_01060 [Candidatus Hodarchaeota archaeon]
MYIGLDLSLSKTGVAFINSNGELKSHHIVKTSPKKTESERIVDIIKRLSYLLGDRSYDCCIIEDTYDRVNYEVYKKLTRLCGAVRFWFHVKYKVEADIIKATSARKLIGLSGNCHKIDAQLFVMGYHKLGTRGQRQKLKLAIDKVRRQYRTNRHKIKYYLNKLSKSLEKETGLSDDEADAIVLAMAGREKYGKR